MKDSLQPSLPPESNGKVAIGRKLGWNVKPFLAEYDSPEAAVAAVKAAWAEEMAPQSVDRPGWGATILYADPERTAEEVMTLDTQQGKWSGSVYTPEMVGGSLAAAKELNVQYVMAPAVMLSQWIAGWRQAQVEKMAALQQGKPDAETKARIKEIKTDLATLDAYSEAPENIAAGAEHERAREQKNRRLLTRASVRNYRVEPAELRGEIEDISGYDRSIVNRKVDAIVAGQDARIGDGNELNRVTDGPRVFIVEDSNTEAVGRRIVAVADLQVPGRWHINPHAALVDRAGVEDLQAHSTVAASYLPAAEESSQETTGLAV